MIIRQFEAEDLNEVLAIESNTFKELDPSIYDFLCEIDTHEFLVAVENNIVIGYIVGYKFSKNEGRISSIAVKYEYRNKRIGVKLLHEMLCIFHRNFLKYVYLEVRISNKKAQQMYRQAGFKLYQIKKRYYLDGEIGIFMRKKLYNFSHQNISCKKMNNHGYDYYNYNNGICTMYIPMQKNVNYI